MENNEYKGIQGHNDFDFLKDLERKSNDDWKGCQGNCDFEDAPNLTGWI